MTRRRLYMLAAGGTGGHLFPARALGVELKRRGHDVMVMTDRRGVAFAGMLKDMALDVIPSGTFAKGGLFEKLKTVGRIAAGAVHAIRLCRRLKPAAVIGFGGYPSLPAMAGAVLTGIPAVIHEQNAVLGRVNALLAPYVDAIATSFEGVAGLKARDRAKAAVTGNPVRAEIAALRDLPYPAFDAVSDLRLLVFGGSQGARILSETAPEAIVLLPPALRARIVVVQQCRAEDIEAVRRKYADHGVRATLATFFQDMETHLKDAHLVIGRAGASTVSELAAAGRPGILVPLPSALRDEQTANALHLAEAGGGWLIPEPQLTPAELAKRIQKLAATEGALAEAAAAARAMGHPEAASDLADLVEETAARSSREGGKRSESRPAAPASGGDPVSRRTA